jgi:hypothetical protein
MFGKKSVKNILVITDQEKDNINLRNQLEKEAISCYGNLYGLRLSENKKVVYLFNFKNEKNFNKFIESDIIKKYEILEA